MFNPAGQGRTFGQHLLIAQSEAGDKVDPTISTHLQQWLEYWNDAESVGSNVRKFEHWLQRARSQQS